MLWETASLNRDKVKTTSNEAHAPEPCLRNIFVNPKTDLFEQDENSGFSHPKGYFQPGVLALDGGDTPESLRAALEQVHAHKGLGVIHVPVYAGPEELGDMGAHGQWNVGNWVDEVQTTYRNTNI